MTSNLSTDEVNKKVLKYEIFINDVLKEDLKKVEERLVRKNAEIAEWMQLKTVLTNLRESDLIKGFKTKMDIGTNIYVQAEVPDASKIIINIGSDIYMEYFVPEALQFIDKRVALLKKQTDIIQADGHQIKARIKLVLHGIQELINIK